MLNKSFVSLLTKIGQDMGMRGAIQAGSELIGMWTFKLATSVTGYKLSYMFDH